MLLFVKNITERLRFAAWNIGEEEAFFREDLPLSAEEENEVALHRDPLRAKEWLASRWLLHQLTDHHQRMPLAKDTYSKPFFVGGTGQYCSLSHSRGTVAALLSPTDCGCDIQVLVEKMPRIAPKFMRPDEYAWAERYGNADHFLIQHVIWTAKEAMYKTYGRKEVDFKAHLYLEPFDFDKSQINATKGWLEKDGQRLDFFLYVGMHEGEGLPFVWTVAHV
jgi:4'-phosphopantetheinyl transferase